MAPPSPTSSPPFPYPSSSSISHAVPVVAFLGTSESGKSTIFKNCRSLYGNVQFCNFHSTQENRILIKTSLQYEIIQHIKRAIKFMEQFVSNSAIVSNTMAVNSPVSDSGISSGDVSNTSIPQLERKTSTRHDRRLSDELINLVKNGENFDHSKSFSFDENSLGDTFLGISAVSAAMRHSKLLETGSTSSSTSSLGGSLGQGSPLTSKTLSIDTQKPSKFNRGRRGSTQSTGSNGSTSAEDQNSAFDVNMNMSSENRRRNSLISSFQFEWNKAEEKIVNKIKFISFKTMNERSWHVDYEGGLKELKSDIKAIWKNNAVRYLFLNATDFNFHISENIIYFMKNINRIFKEDYKPTEDDYLKMRAQTTGIHSVDVKISKSTVVKVYDTGGERCERKKWSLLLEAKPDVIIYVVAVADFDVNSCDQKNKNKLQESIEVLKSVCQEMNKRNLESEFVIVLNKMDVFKEKIEEKDKSISVIFPDFEKQGMQVSAFSSITSSTGGINISTEPQNVYDNSRKYIGRLFYDIIRTELNSTKSIHMYEMSAIDKSFVKYLFEDGLDSILRQSESNPPPLKNDNLKILLNDIGVSEVMSMSGMMKDSGKKSAGIPKPTVKKRGFSTFISNILKRPSSQTQTTSLVPKQNLFDSVTENMPTGPPKRPHKLITNPKLTPEEEEAIKKTLETAAESKGTDYSEKYAIKKRIGLGAQAAAYIVSEKDATDKKFYVMKRIKLRTIQELNQNFNEIKSLYSLRHEYINSIHDFFVEQKESTIIADNIGSADSDSNSGKQEYVLCIILEFCKGGDLRMYLDRFKKKGANSLVSQTLIVNWLKKLTAALVFIHSKGYLHRDLKPENIFFNDNEREELRIGDFGLSCIVKSVENAKVGTECYMSPEQAKGQDYSASSDIWSLGVIVLEILSQRMVDVKEELSKNENYVSDICNELKDIYSEELLDFVQMTLQLDPSARPSSSEQLMALVENIE